MISVRFQFPKCKRNGIGGGDSYFLFTTSDPDKMLISQGTEKQTFKSLITLKHYQLYDYKNEITFAAGSYPSIVTIQKRF